MATKILNWILSGEGENKQKTKVPGRKDMAFNVLILFCSIKITDFCFSSVAIFLPIYLAISQQFYYTA
jgi:hypothetical protein